ncbi:ribonuclease P protein component [Tanticharoenia sakaeratensis]|uniref:Ribonuclease P protein component n=1 Tax=Tanticharoenia sakaeratensis NBRC 103193 TaxID=1231623 RepID=A0A0D6MKY3_9PROT|nr:ribonuclease P protein component [Tanticharoenia sakaeratensis]GAN54282.1 ribonuclease P protein component [Tanticharoenia sakaeratensis NBRC 103193]GBQ19060.1 ribonuclease P protein component [Tanticharoenia sakaeratensis NBRC 103193]
MPRASIGRLKQRAEFLRAAKHGQKVATPGLVLQILPRPETGEARAGFTVTKKVGNAVVRNRTRRRLRAALQAVASEHSLQNVDVVLIGRDQTRARAFTDLVDDLRRSLRKGSLLP